MSLGKTILIFQMMPSVKILCGDWLERLRELPDGCAQCCVTSPPYWGLRDYGVPGQLGLEKTPEEYVEKVVVGFREVMRVLRDDGTLWLNLGDSYASNGGHTDTSCNDRRGQYNLGNRPEHNRREFRVGAGAGLKQKDLVGIPWMVAFALRADGWYLRSDIIWHKPNPMPESITDRPTKSHEYIFLLSKRKSYFYDAEAVKEEPNGGAHARVKANGKNSRMILERAIGREDSKPNPSRSNVPGVTPKSAQPGSGIKANSSYQAAMVHMLPDRNKRSVWTVATAPYREAHFATFPPNLIKPCILAGSRPGDIVLDPFAGSGTTGQVSLELGRNCIGIELNPKYVEMAQQRCNVTPGLALA